MQRINTSRRRRPAGDGPVRGHRQYAALESIGTPSASRMTTLVPAFGQALPTLETVPTEYNHEVNAELLYDLGAALVKAGFAALCANPAHDAHVSPTRSTPPPEVRPLDGHLSRRRPDPRQCPTKEAGGWRKRCPHHPDEFHRNRRRARCTTSGCDCQLCRQSSGIEEHARPRQRGNGYSGGGGPR
jgi:hypothetical protein